MKDLFGFLHSEAPRDDYQDYINSPKWKKIRQAKLDASGHACERCGISKYSARLEVHHKDYKNFKSERLSDLEVLCPECHALADAERRLATEEKHDKRKTEGSLVRGFENWMDYGNDEHWRKKSDSYLSGKWSQFLVYLEERSGKFYDATYQRSPRWK